MKNNNDNRIHTVDIKHIIKERLKLQTTQRNLHEKFNIPQASYELLISPSFLSRLRLFDDFSKKSFYASLSFRPLYY